MVLVSYSGREINAKLVYYGPGLSGKTTNLEYIYGSIPQGQRGKMVSMKTKTERTLFFDFLPVNLGELSGFKTRFLLYTVPGQVYYNATRKLVLKGVDAVVFVADSKRGKMDENLESLENLRQNLLEQGVDLDTIPWVVQYNKRDLQDVYTIDELEEVLNPYKVPVFEAVATTGQGVVDTFKGVSRLLLRKLSKDIGAPAPGKEAAATEQTPVGGAPRTQELPHAPDPMQRVESAEYHPEPVRKAEPVDDRYEQPVRKAEPVEERYEPPPRRTEDVEHRAQPEYETEPVDYRSTFAREDEQRAHRLETRHEAESIELRREARHETEPMENHPDSHSCTEYDGVRRDAAEVNMPLRKETGFDCHAEAPEDPPRVSKAPRTSPVEEEDRIATPPDTAAPTEERLAEGYSQEQERRGFSVGDRLRRWLSRPNGVSGDGIESVADHEPIQPAQDGPQEADVPEYTLLMDAPPVATPELSVEKQIEEKAPSVLNPVPVPVTEEVAESSSAVHVPPRKPKPTRAARPREVLVPLELRPQDLERGIVLKLVMQMPQSEENAYDEDEDEAA